MTPIDFAIYHHRLLCTVLQKLEMEDAVGAAPEQRAAGPSHIGNIAYAPR